MLIHNRVNGDNLLPLRVQILLPTGESYNLSNHQVEFKLFSFSGEEINLSGSVEIIDHSRGIVEYHWEDNDYNHFNGLLSISPGLSSYQYKGWFRIRNQSNQDYFYPQNNEGITIEIINPSGENIKKEVDIQELLFSPKKIKNLEGQIEERSVNELIEAEMWRSAKNADKVPWGIRIARTRPSSSIS